MKAYYNIKNGESIRVIEVTKNFITVDSFFDNYEYKDSLLNRSFTRVSNG